MSEIDDGLRASFATESPNRATSIRSGMCTQLVFGGGRRPGFGDDVTGRFPGVWHSSELSASPCRFRCRSLSVGLSSCGSDDGASDASVTTTAFTTTTVELEPTTTVELEPTTTGADTTTTTTPVTTTTPTTTTTTTTTASPVPAPLTVAELGACPPVVNTLLDGWEPVVKGMQVQAEAAVAAGDVVRGVDAVRALRPTSRA